MHYEINVSLKGKHYFGTHERSLTDFEDAREMYLVFKKKFPASKGYEISLSEYDTLIRTIDCTKGEN